MFPGDVVQTAETAIGPRIGAADDKLFIESAECTGVGLFFRMKTAARRPATGTGLAIG